MIEDAKHRHAATIAMQNPEQWCLQVWYIDKAGEVTERTVSPVRLTGRGMLVYCLGRQDVRMLIWSRVVGMRFRLTADVLPDGTSIKLLVERTRSKRLDKSTDTT